MNATGKTIVLVAAIFIAGCQSSSDDVEMDGCQAEGRYFPLETGFTWTYSATDLDSGQREIKSQTVGDLEVLDGAKSGIEAFRVTTEKPGGMVISWQEDTGAAVLRHLEHDLAGGTQTEELYDPYKVRIDESDSRIVVGATWTDQYTEQIVEVGTGQQSTTPKTETWDVQAVDEEITVPAGTFCALRVHRTSMAVNSGSDKMYWFARGVGKIRESGATRTEDLVSFTP